MKVTPLLAVFLILGPALFPAVAQTPVPSAQPVVPSGQEQALPAQAVSPLEALEKLRPTEDTLFAEAVALQDGKNPGQAISVFLDLLRFYPDGRFNEETLQRVAECYRALGRFPEALATLKLARQKYPEGAWLAPGYLLEGEMLLADQKWKEALDPLQKAAASKTPAVQRRALFLTVVARENLGQLAAAQPELEKLAALTQDNPQLNYARVRLAMVLEAGGKPREALALYLAAIKDASDLPGKAEASVRAGNLCYQQKNYKDAAAYFESIRKTEVPAFWRNLAHAGLLQSLFALGDYEGAVKLYNEVKPQFPDALRAQMVLLAAESCRLSGRDADAVALYEFIVREFPQDPVAEGAAWGRLLILAKLKDEKLLPATAVFISAYPKSSRLFSAKMMRADGTFEKKDYAAVAPMYGDLVKDPKFKDLDADQRAGVWFRLCQAAFNSKDYAKSVAAGEEFIKLSPKSPALPAVLWLSGQAQQELKQPDKALETWLNLTKNFPDFSQHELALWKSAALAGTLKRYDVMKSQLEGLLQKYPKTERQADAHYWLGICALELKKPEDGRAHWEKARALAPDLYFERSTQELLQLNLKKEDLGGVISELSQYDQWRTNHPNAPLPGVDVVEWVGYRLDQTKDQEKAVPYYRRVLALSKDAKQKQRVQWWLANLLSEEQDWQAALSEWKSYRANFPDEANRSVVLVPLAQAYIGEGDYDPARQLAEQILRQNPEGEFNARGRLLLGDIAFSQKKYDEAAKIYSAVALLMDDPVLTPVALKKSEMAYRQAGKTAQADQASLDLARRFPEKR